MLAVILSLVVRMVTNDFMLHPALRVFSMSSSHRAALAAERADGPDMAFLMRENYVEMCRGVFLFYGVMGLLVVPTFILILMNELREPGPIAPLGLFLTSLLNVSIVGGVMVVSYWMAISLRDRFCEGLSHASQSSFGSNASAANAALESTARLQAGTPTS